MNSVDSRVRIFQPFSGPNRFRTSSPPIRCDGDCQITCSATDIQDRIVKRIFLEKLDQIRLRLSDIPGSSFLEIEVDGIEG
jgi:hypothetical protein